jgi:hypothetical protein
MRRIRVLGKIAAVASSMLLGAAFVCSYAGWIQIPFLRVKRPAPIVASPSVGTIVPAPGANPLETPDVAASSQDNAGALLPGSKSDSSVYTLERPAAARPQTDKKPAVIMGGSKYMLLGIYARDPDPSDASPPARSTNGSSISSLRTAASSTQPARAHQ